MTVVHANSTAAVVDAVRAATTLDIIGAGSRRSFGHAVRAETVLDLSGFVGAIDHDPAELVVTVRPGTPVAEIVAVLAANGQQLAFEPPDLAPLWGGAPGAGSIGGLVAAGLAGPRRLAAGGVRDHVLGFEAVNGLGEVFVAGGKVLKNVTGFDLPKLIAASWGTLAVLTEISLKALPMAADSGSLVISGLGVADAVAAMTRALQGNVPITGAAHLPGAPARTLLRLEGPARVLAVQRDAAAAALAVPADWIDAADSQALWRDIGAVQPFVADDVAVLWRVVLPATATPVLVAALGGKAGVLLDWGGGLAWVWHDDDVDVDVRRLAAAGGGHATLVRAPDTIKARVPVFPPSPPALAALYDRVRAAFDPAGKFNPGRMGT